MIGTNIVMCYCTFLHFTAYSIAAWAVLKQEFFMSHIYLLMSERTELHVYINFCKKSELL